MNAIRTTAVLALALLAVAGRGSDVERERTFETVSPAELIVGTWVATRADDGTLPKDAVVEFRRGGKMIIAMTTGNEQMRFECAYKVGKASFTIVAALGDQESKQTIQIKSLTTTTLSTIDKDGKVVELRRKR